MSTQQNRKPKLRLPFNDKKTDMGEWAFDHRAGLCITVIAYLLFAITFVSAKIFVGGEHHSQGFYIDLEDIQALEELKEIKEQEIAQKEEFDWGSVSNSASNEYSLEQQAINSTGENEAALNNEADRAKEIMEANRQAFEDALNKIEADRQATIDASQEGSTERRDVKQQGNVTVSYAFANPVRHAQNLIVPAYQCQGGGEVVIAAQLNQQGKVVKAEVSRGGDKCMQETALRAAKASTFNTAENAPESHSGTITYIFIPQ
ncbi:MAG: energy transducer TonB [Rikenellaceae bacterium]